MITTFSTDYILENKDSLTFGLEFIWSQGDTEDTLGLEVGKLSELDFEGVYLGYNYRLWVFDSRNNDWLEVDKKLYLPLISRKTVEECNGFTLVTYANESSTETEIYKESEYITRTFDSFDGKLSVDVANSLIASIKTMLYAVIIIRVCLL